MKTTLSLVALCLLVACTTASSCPGFSYSGGSTGPTVWGSLCPEYATCKTGENQSPVNFKLNNIEDVEDNVFDFTYRRAKDVDVTNANHIITATNNAESSFYFANDDFADYFDLKSVEVHTPSEHTIDGKALDAEIQFIHESEDGRVAIISYLVKEGGSCDLLKELEADLPEEGETTTIDSLTPITPSSTYFLHYTGSLTSPPCTENVEWFVQEESISCSSSQISKISKAAGKSARPVVSLKDRTVTRAVVSGASVLSSSLFVGLALALLCVLF